MVPPKTSALTGGERSSAGGTSSTEDEDYHDAESEEVMQVAGTTSNLELQISQNVAEPSSNDLNQALEKLHSLCQVLGINYNSKLAEFGTSVDTERLEAAVNFLGTTKEKNFQELKRISKEMISEWSLSRAPFKRMNSFAWIIYIVDASSAEGLSARNLLSTESVNRARKEVIALKKEREDAIKRRYTSKSNKLRDLLKGTHLSYDDVEFSPKKQEQVKDLKSEIQSLKQMIKTVKSLASKRTELVLRVELVLKAKSLQDLEVLISNAKSAAKALETDDNEHIHYDGKTVEDVLNIYRDQYVNNAAKREEKKAKALPTDKNLPTGRTRKGTRYGMSHTCKASGMPRSAQC